MASRSTRRLFDAAPLATALLLAAGLAAGEEKAPDLRLEWLVDGRPAAGDAAALHGPAGEVAEVRYRLRNVGSRDAFAAVVEARTALGRLGSRDRLQPGPRVGSRIDRSLQLTLARGMRELCVQVRLQNLRAEDPQDPNLEDNRICRAVRLEDDRAPDLALPTRRHP